MCRLYIIFSNFQIFSVFGYSSRMNVKYGGHLIRVGLEDGFKISLILHGIYISE